MTLSLERPTPERRNVPTQAACHSSRAQLHHVKVQALQGECCVVICADGLLVLPVAAGCLMQPAPGDLVLASVAHDAGYIIQVLSRSSTQPTQLRIEGDAELRVRDGRLRMCADTLDIQANTLSLHAQRMLDSGLQRQSNWDQRVDVTGHQQSFIERRELHIERSVRRVAGHEEQSAGSVRLIVAQDWRVRADTADLLGGRRVKVDADTVQLG